MIRIFRVYLYFGIVFVRFYYHYKFRIKSAPSEEGEKKTSELWRSVGMQTARILANLGGIYIKLGQFLSNAVHLFPDEFLEPLQSLQDKVPPSPYSVMKERFVQEWNAEPQDIFEDFNFDPIASASTAQVHKATYQGMSVAVKVLYPGIETSFQRDMKAIYRILRWIDSLVFPIPYEDIYKQLYDLFCQEIDLNLELKNMEQARYLLRKDHSIIIPSVIRELSTGKILVTEFIQGEKWNQVAQVKSPVEPKSYYVEILIRTYIKMIFHFQFFHADPHPGNIFITKDGRICFLDFGAVGRIREEDEAALVMIFHSVLQGKPSGILEGLELMNVLDDTIDRGEILGLIEYTIQRIQNIVGSLENFRNIRLEPGEFREDLEYIRKMKTGLRDLVRALKLPPHYVSLQRTADLLIGTIAWVDPFRSVFEYSEKPFRDIVLSGNLFPWRVISSND